MTPCALWRRVLHEIFSQVINQDIEKKSRADRIVDDIQSVLQGKVIKTMLRGKAIDQFIGHFQAQVLTADFHGEKIKELADHVWGEVQRKLGV